MKNIRETLIGLLIEGNCAPLINVLARKSKEPASTIHYNTKKLEQDGEIIAYKAVFAYKKIGMGFCSYVLVNLTSDEYGTPDRIGNELAKLRQIESVDVVTGECELVLKVRTKDIDEYYEFVKTALSRKGIAKIKTMNSMKQLKTEFIKV